MSVKGYVAGLTLAATLVMTSGCEWSSGGGASSWSDSYNWVNFSGTYRGIGGGVLVTDYTTTPGTPGTTNEFAEVAGHTGTGPDGAALTVYSGQLSHGSIVPGSVTITIGTVISFQDNGSSAFTGGKGGSINYGTGVWTVDCGEAAPAAGISIGAAYEYSVQGASGSGDAGSGASGATIYSFVVWQNGQELQITDNNGRTYSGTMGSVSGTLTSTNQSAIVGDSIVAQFSAEGISAANFRVTIAGNLQGVVGGAAGAAYLNNRKMFGTWIEDGGRTGDVNGETSPIAVTATAAPAAE